MVADTDVLIAGAGPAGCVAAVLLARAGFAVQLVDPCQPTALRSESLPPNGQGLIEDLGLTQAFETALLGQPAYMSVFWRDTPERRKFDTPPWLLSRQILHVALRSAALAVGARLITARVTEINGGTLSCRSDASNFHTRARFILDARGRAAGGLIRTGPARVALPFRTQTSGEARDSMGIAALKDGWLWWNARIGGQVDGAFFTSPDVLSGLAPDQRAALLHSRLAQHPGLFVSEKVVTGTPSGAGTGTAPVLSDGGIVRIGDAALSRDPIGAHGLVQAIRSATQAAAAVTTFLRNPGSGDAARAFLTERHQIDTRTARQVTARAYQDQCRFASTFWREGARADNRPDVRDPVNPASDAILGLTVRSHPVPVLSAGMIDWAEGMTLPGSGKTCARLGALGVPAILSILSRPAPLPELFQRVCHYLPDHAAADLLEALISEGVLADKSQTGTGHPA